SEISSILDLLINDLNKRLSDKQLTVSVTERAKNYIVDAGYDPVYGARPLKRFVQSSVETLIARLMISEDIEPNTTLEVDYDGRQLIINH
ncbi:MAG TPA: type VI secretion system ATPase TssH, partial [Sedimentibacter sp.]|nr:type VI secretion system ATPase TssH [Sedimentibacter sp.]